MTIQDAKKYAVMSLKKRGDTLVYMEEVIKLIDKIYESRGSCNECKYGGMKNNINSQCEVDGIFHPTTHYCAYFKRE